MHAMAKMARMKKNRQPVAIFAKIANFATIAGDLNWMPKVVIWRLPILAKIARGLGIMAINVKDPS